MPNSWSTIHPFPGVKEAGRGYFSVPLNACYLPMHTCEAIGPLVAGEINETDLADFMGIAAHEMIGHAALSSSLTKQLCRLTIIKAYTVLLNMMYGNSSRYMWEYFEYLTQSTSRIIGGIALVEELFATVAGIELVKWNLPSKASEIEQKFIATQSGKNCFGKDFEKLYGPLSNAYHKAGYLALTLAAEYAAGYVDVVEGESLEESLVGFSLEKLSEESCKTRFYQVIEELNRAPFRSAVLREWTREAWIDFFGRKLPGYWEEQKKAKQALEIIANLIYDSSPYPYSSGSSLENVASHPLNPASGVIAMLFNDVKVNVLPPNLNPFKMEVNIREEVLQAFSDVMGDYIPQRYFAKLFSARSADRVLVVCTNKNYRSVLGGLVLAPIALEGTNNIIPIPYIAADWDLLSVEPHVRASEWLNKLGDARMIVGTTFFFEGIRQQVANRCGLRCPFWGTIEEENSPSECCGRADLLRQLWEEGRLAQDQWDWSFKNWEIPECLRASFAGD